MMPKIRIKDLLNVVEENVEIKIKGYYNRISYGMEDISDNYLRRYVLEVRTSMDNYNPVLEIYFEDEVD
jgi:hypothetical protein